MADGQGTRFLLFRVAGLLCGADAATVREIMPVPPATRVPGAADEVLGVINVRGTVVTAVDARRCLGQPTGQGAGSLILLDYRDASVALVVDEVIDLISVPRTELAAREGLPGIEARFVQAVGRHGDRSFALLDTAALLQGLLPV